MKKVAVIGYFGENGSVCSGGQSVKTTILTEELERNFSDNEICRINTAGWKNKPWNLLKSCAKAVKKCKNVIFLTDDNGIKVFPVLLLILNWRKTCSIQYYVVGGWLTSYIKQKKWINLVLKRLDAIYVELNSMYDTLKEAGFMNAVLVNKFRRISMLSVEDLPVSKDTRIKKLCYFSRVTQEKGVEDAIAGVIRANENSAYYQFELDIYGTIDSNYANRFKRVLNDSPEYIKYCGVVDFFGSAQVLKDYYAMIFPTYFGSEGYPNTVVDAYAAGLPIVATRWNYNAEIIRDGEDGYLYEVGEVGQLANILLSMTESSEKYQKMREKCLERCKEYLPENAICKVIQNLK